MNNEKIVPSHQNPDIQKKSEILPIALQPAPRPNSKPAQDNSSSEADSVSTN
jgi:hypothetical protein